MIRKIVVIFFSLLSVAFFFRFIQYGYKWLSHASSPDFNYKALTAWCAIYVVVCAGVAWGVSKLPREEDADDVLAEKQ